MSQGETVLIDLSLRELFVPLIHSAGHDLKFELNPIAESYLLSLLEAGVFTNSIFVKDDDLGDPLINDEHIIAFGWANKEQINSMKNFTYKVNDILKELFIN